MGLTLSSMGARVVQPASYRAESDETESSLCILKEMLQLDLSPNCLVCQAALQRLSLTVFLPDISKRLALSARFSRHPSLTLDPESVECSEVVLYFGA